MKALVNLLVKNLKTNIITFLIVMGIGVTGFLLYFYLVGPQNLYGATNSLIIPLVVSFAAIGFYLLNYFGMFDTMAYGFSSMTSMFSKSGDRKYHDLIEYRDARYEKHKGGPIFLPSLLLAFLICVIAFVVVYVVFKITFPQ